MFTPESLLCPGRFLLVTDELASPADFLLHRCLNFWLKDHKNRRCILLCVSEDLSRWKAVAAKSNVDLEQHLKSGSLVFVDLLSHVRLPSLNGSTMNNDHLRPALDATFAAFDNGGYLGEMQQLVILDDITSLLWIGFSHLDLTRFFRALHARCLKSKATLSIRHHILTPNEPDDLFRQLLQLCNYRMNVRALSSGRSGAVSGEVALNTGPAANEVKRDLAPRSTILQYRLTDGGCVFFERGTGAGIL